MCTHEDVALSKRTFYHPFKNLGEVNGITTGCVGANSCDEYIPHGSPAHTNKIFF